MLIQRVIEDLFDGTDGPGVTSIEVETTGLRVTFDVPALGPVELRLAPRGSLSPRYARIQGFDVVTLHEPRHGTEAETERSIREILERIDASGTMPGQQDWDESLGGRSDDRFVFGSVAEVKITRSCDQRCIFCKSPPGIANMVEVDEALDVLPRLAMRATLVTISGGEPTLSPGLVDVVTGARRAGFSQVELQSNGMNLADRHLVRRLVDAGMGIALISLHASTQELSDELTATPGGFERTLHGIDNCLEAGVSVSVCHVICRRNVSRLAEYGAFVARRFHGRGVHVVFTLSLPNYRVRSNPGLMPSLVQTAPGLCAALDRLRPARDPGSGSASVVMGSVMHGSGLPMCAIPRHLRFHDEFWEPSCTDETQERTHVEACGDCSVRSRCSGLWKVYLDLYGTEGIEPIGSETVL